MSEEPLFQSDPWADYCPYGSTFGTECTPCHPCPPCECDLDAIAEREGWNE
jgi:hypothetical protein